jgi:hypothetical protein
VLVNGDEDGWRRLQMMVEITERRRKETSLKPSSNNVRNDQQTMFEIIVKQCSKISSGMFETIIRQCSKS